MKGVCTLCVKVCVFAGMLLNQFDERDIERINKDDLYVWLFIKHKQRDLDKALDMVVSCLFIETRFTPYQCNFGSLTKVLWISLLFTLFVPLLNTFSLQTIEEFCSERC